MGDQHYSDQDLERMKFPIGQFTYEDDATTELRRQRMDELAATPVLLRQAVEGLSDAQLDTAYRPGGWTVRQVVHHLADASMNGFIRAKLALSESVPIIKPFEENDWVKQADVSLPVEASLKLLEGLHLRFDALLRALSPEEFSTSFMHPATGLNTIDKLLAYFAWHGKQHTAHITSLCEREGW